VQATGSRRSDGHVATGAARTAMIELRRARGRWNDDTTDDTTDDTSERTPPDSGQEPCSPLEIQAFDLATSVLVRDRSACADRQIRLEHLVKRADVLRERLKIEAQAEGGAAVSTRGDQAHDEVVTIDLRDADNPTVTHGSSSQPGMFAPDDIHSLVEAIRRLSVLREAGVITTSEFDDKLTDLLAQV